MIYLQATRQDTENDYTLMCECLFQELPADGKPTIKASDAETEARVQQVMDELAHISKRGRKLALISQRYASLIQQAVNIAQNAPQVSPVVFGSAEAALGVYTGQREVVGEGGKQALKGTEKLWNAFASVQQIVEARHVLAIQLEDLVPQFSGPETNRAQFGCSFAEHVPGFLEVQTKDSLALTNSSGQELHNCVVAVRLSDAAGNSYLNLYFVPDWQIDEKRVAKYSSFDFPKDTVDGIVRVEVGLYSKECSMQPFALKKPKSGWPGLE
jgi:hypothetical protein